MTRLFWIFLSVVVLSLGGTYIYLENGLPDVGQVADYRPDGSLEMRAEDGTVIYQKGSGPQERATRIPKVLQQATIASEDRRFLEHYGVDPMGIGRALVNNIRQGDFVEGGSTITQQLARVLFLNRDKTLGRKVQEALLAFKLEQTYSKTQLLTFYLNYSYFGSGAYGVSDASRIYFNKPLADLTASEAATLIGVLPAPSIYSPYNNPELAQKRRDIVLNKMVRAGFLTENAAQRLIDRAPRYASSRNKRDSNGYFTSYVESLLPTLIDRDRLEQGGLVVETTLDAQAQIQAQTILTQRVKGFRRVSQGALVSLDPTTGAIRALVGGVDYRQSQFNRATQARRQPGSSFKTWVYLTALEQGIAPTKIYVDRPMAFGNYRPKNSDGKFLGPLNLMEALAKSRNPIAIQLIQEVGIDQTIATAQRVGIASPLRSDATLALGSSEVTLLEFTSAYGVLANGGVRVEPFAVARILDRRGAVLYQAEPKTEQVVNPQMAWMMTQLLHHAVTAGTGQATQVKFPAAGKTGTTDLGRDLLFMGYTPQLATGVWLGNDDDTPTYASSKLAAQVWGAYMRTQVKANSPDFTEPEDLDPERKAQILASLGIRPSRPSLVDLAPAPTAELPPTELLEPSEPILPPLEAAPEPESAPVPAPVLNPPTEAPPNCYERSTDSRCRNRKN